MKKVFEKTLYSMSKSNGMKTWTIRVYDQKTSAKIEVATSAGEGFKEVIRSEVVSAGKNIGRSNQTTPLEQALNEAESRYQEKIKKGYKTTKKAGKEKTNALGYPIPMKAHPLEEDTKLTFPAWIQPKLDGHRAIITVGADGKPLIYSYNGTIITTVDHILKEAKHLKANNYLDGELYIHGMRLQDITKLIKKYRPGESEKLKFHAYDLVSSEEFLGRSLDLIYKTKGTSNITLVDTQVVNDMEEVLKLNDIHLKAGYEGSILRLAGKGYESGHRSRYVWKIKDFKDHEYEVIDITAAKEVTIQGTTYSPARLWCIGKGELKCEPFDLFAPGTMEEKSEVLKNKKDYLGTLVTVKHSGFTKDNKPWHPVAKCFRDDI